MQKNEYQIISVLIESEPGALSRVTQLFSARGYNIESLSVAPTEDPSLAAMTIITRTSQEQMQQVTKQLNKLIEVYKVTDMSTRSHLERELMLVRVQAETPDSRAEVSRVVNIFRARVVNITTKHYIIEITGNRAKTDAFLNAIGVSQVLETVRTGLCSITKG